MRRSHDFTRNSEAALFPVLPAVQLFHAVMTNLSNESIKRIFDSLQQEKPKNENSEMQASGVFLRVE